MSPDTLSRSIEPETAGSDRTRADRWRLLGHLFRLLVGALALVLVAIFLLSSLGLIDWQWLGQQFGPPWNSLLNPYLAPKTILLLAGEGLIYLVIWIAALFLSQPMARGILGEGTLVVFRRLVFFCGSLPVVAAGYLLFWISPASLRVDLQVHGDGVSLTLPTLLGTLIFGFATLLVPPKTKRVYLPWFLIWVARLTVFPAAMGVVLFLNRSIVGTHLHEGLLQAVVTQAALFGVEILYLLTALEAFRADWVDFRQIHPRGRGLGGLALARAAIRLFVFLAPVAFGAWLALGATLPSASILTDRHGHFLRFYNPSGEYRIHASAREISPWMKMAIEAIEDPGIYRSPHLHLPVNPVRAVGVFTTAMRSVQDRESSNLSGGSGIAAQVSKNYYGRDLVGLVRSIPSWLPLRGPIVAAFTVIHKLAFEFECGWAYERISILLGDERSPITLYLNAVYFGQGAHGVQAASLTYFGKQAKDLNPAEAALLAGLPQAPSYLDPWQRPDEVKARRGQVLRAMVREGHISESEMVSLDAAPLGILPEPLNPNRDSLGLSQFTRYLMTWLDAHGFHDLSTRGLVVTTSLDYQRQMDLEEQVRVAVERLGSQGVNNGAAVVLDAQTGGVLAWFGGVHSLYGPGALPDMVSGFPHQPGSTLKPLLYACALEEGQLHAEERLDDTPRVIGGRYIANWDLDQAGRGMRPAREELAESRNAAAAELVDRLGPEGFVQCLRHRFRIQTDLHPEQHGVELGLGLAEMPMLELAGAYTVLASGGAYAEPTPVLRLRDRSGRELYKANPNRSSQSLSPNHLEWVRAALSDVSEKLGIPAEAATKTGTTPSSSYVMGYDTRVILAGWLGRTEPGRGRMEIDNVDGREAALSIWKPQTAR